MNKTRLDIAIAEARRFVTVATEAKRRIAEYDGSYTATKETGAARRASMDLTRALAELRRYGG